MITYGRLYIFPFFHPVPMASVTLVGSSHVRRLRDAIHTKSDHAFIEDFGISQAKLGFVCKGGWTM